MLGAEEMTRLIDLLAAIRAGQGERR